VQARRIVANIHPQRLPLGLERHTHTPRQPATARRTDATRHDAGKQPNARSLQQTHSHGKPLNLTKS